MDIQFLAPDFLLALILVPVVWFWPRRARDLGHVGIRSLLLALVILGLARPVTVQETGELHQVLVLDRSASSAEGERVAADALAAGWREGLATDTQATLVALGGAAPAGWDASAAPVLLVEEPGGSPLGAGLAAAARAIPLGARGAITLVSDGLATDDARSLGGVAQDLSARGIPVHLAQLPKADDHARPVRLEALGTWRVGHAARLEVLVAGLADSVTLRLSAEGRELDRIEGVRCAGRTSAVFEFEPDEAGFVRLTVQVMSETGEAHPASDELTRTLAVQQPLRALYLGGRMAGGAERLGDLVGRGFELVESEPAAQGGMEALAGFDAVVLDDRPATDVPEPLQQAITQAVAQRGLGLLAAGGAAAFGPGGYLDTPIAEFLPVEFVQKEEKRDPSTALVVIIDTSGSMGGNRVQLAKEVTRLAIRRLLPHDKVGIVEFYGAKRWAAPLQPASNSIEIERALNRLDAGGGTVILPAIEEAFYGMQNVDTRYKHVLVLTDGGVEQGAFEPLLRRMAAEGMNVSTVLIGSNAHSEFLVSLSNWGKGRFYSVPNRFNLPEILLKQPTSAKLPAYRSGLHAVNARGGPGWWGDVDPSEVPAVGGYVETRARPGAETLIETETGHHPVLASWRYGLGRVTAFMTEPTGPGTDPWAPWPGYGPFLARVLGKTASDGRAAYSFKIGREGLRVSLVAERRVADAPPPRAAIVAREGESRDAPERPFVFRERADGLYTASRVVATDSDARVLAGVQGDPHSGTWLVSAAQDDVAAEHNVDPERALEFVQLARATGGVLLAPEGLADFRPPVGGGAAPAGLHALWPLCWWAALALYLIELAYRRRPTPRRALS